MKQESLFTSSFKILIETLKLLNAGMKEVKLQRICIGMKLQERAWGGGNMAIGAVSRFFQQCGIEVVHDLSLPNADIVLLTDPRRYLASCSFDDREIAEEAVRGVA